MSISSSTRKAGPYSCNGSTVAFPFAFKVFATADVRVVLTDANAVESDLVLGANYTVALNADQDANPGGTVTTTTTYATGYLVTLTSQVQNLQPVTLTNQGGFYPQVINNALDRVTIMVQQLAEKTDRSVKVGISSALSPDELVGSLLSAVGEAQVAADDAAQAMQAAEDARDAAIAAASTFDPVNAQAHAAPGKALPVDADEIPIADSADSWSLKKLTIINLMNRVWSSLGGLIGTGVGKSAPVDSDYFPIMDSADSNATKSLSWSAIKAALKSYFDTIYATAGTYVTSVGGNTGSVTNAQVASATLAGLGYTPAKDDIGVGGIGNFPIGAIVVLEVPASSSGGALSAGAAVSGSGTRFPYKNNGVDTYATPAGTWRNIGPTLSYISSSWCASSVFQRIL